MTMDMLTNMRGHIMALCLLALCLSACQPSHDTNAMPVLFDTDLGNDVDDVLALQMLANYHRQGKINLIGLTVSKANKHAVEFADAYCRYNGLDDIPLGHVYDGPNPEDGLYLLPTLRAVYDGKPVMQPKRSVDDGTIPPAVNVLRQQLAMQPNHAVTLIAVGPLTNISRLLDSPADEYSKLTGVELVKQKVRTLYIMGGKFSPDGDGLEWNIMQDRAAAANVFARCPVPVVASGHEIGSALHYPHESILHDFGCPEAHPACVAYMNYIPMPYDRETWDLTAVLAAVEMGNTLFQLSEAGTIEVDEESRTIFHPSANGLHYYLKLSQEHIPQTLQLLVQRATGQDVTLAE